MNYNSKEEILNANLMDWEKEVILKEFEFRKNLSEIGELILELNGVKK